VRRDRVRDDDVSVPTPPSGAARPDCARDDRIGDDCARGRRVGGSFVGDDLAPATAASPGHVGDDCDGADRIAGFVGDPSPHQ
jgi:hypothetical protein